MAWDPNEKGSWAWLTKEASEQGGVNQLIDGIHDGGYQEGHDKGMIEGAVGAAVAVVIIAGICKGAQYVAKKISEKKQSIKDCSEASEATLRKIYEESQISNQNNDDQNDEI